VQPGDEQHCDTRREQRLSDVEDQVSQAHKDLTADDGGDGSADRTQENQRYNPEFGSSQGLDQQRDYDPCH
jgi:hypothetical protein